MQASVYCQHLRFRLFHPGGANTHTRRSLPHTTHSHSLWRSEPASATQIAITPVTFMIH